MTATLTDESVGIGSLPTEDASSLLLIKKALKGDSDYESSSMELTAIKSAHENRRFALVQLQSLLDIALKHTAKKKVTGEVQSATAISKDQLQKFERLPAAQRDECLLAVDKIQALLKQHGKVTEVKA